jgi:hypothetical protein
MTSTWRHFYLNIVGLVDYLFYSKLMTEREPSYAPCPPYRKTAADEAELRARKALSRRTLLRRTAAAVVALKFGGISDDVANELLWPRQEMKVSLVPGSEHLPKGGEEWVVFGGLGQSDSRSAAQEFFAAQGRNQVVSSVQYDTDGIDAHSVATVLARHIKERDIKRLSIVGVSMGTPTFMLAWSELQRQTVQGYEDVAQDTKIQRLVAYSSPFDMQDAWQRELGHLTAESGYRGGVIGKFLFSLVDGPGDLERTLPTNSASELWDHVKQSWSQTVNSCPPKLYVSQLRLLDSANLLSREHDYTSSFAAGAQFAYCEPTNADTVVYDNGAIGKYFTLFKPLDVEQTVVPVPHGGHANTELSAIALKPWLTSTDDIALGFN